MSCVGFPNNCSGVLQLCEGEDEPQQRPEVSEEDLIGAKDKLGLTVAKSKTMEVMEECGEQCNLLKTMGSGVSLKGESVSANNLFRPVSGLC